MLPWRGSKQSRNVWKSCLKECLKGQSKSLPIFEERNKVLQKG